jgi:hypothetical protein
MLFPQVKKVYLKRSDLLRTTQTVRGKARIQHCLKPIVMYLLVNRHSDAFSGYWKKTDVDLKTAGRSFLALEFPVHLIMKPY